MPAFAYRAVDATGKARRGVLEAASPSGARQSLREQNLLPLSVEATGPARTGSDAASAPPWERWLRPRLRPKVLAVVTRQLSTLIGSDVRIEEALGVVARQNAAGPAGPLLLNVRGAVLEGRGLAAAMADHPEAFPDFYRASIAAGEQSGRLADVLAHLTEHVESRERARRKIQLALMYPALLAGVSGAMILLMMIYVVPDIAKVFVTRGAELPVLTRGLIAISDALQRWGWLILIGVIALGFGVRRWYAAPDNRMRVARLIARTPPLAAFSRQLNSARFAGSLATLVRSDVPLVEAVTAAAAVVPNVWVRTQASAVADRVREGTSLTRAMTDADCFPPMLLAVVASGESGGRLGDAVGRAAVDLERDLDQTTAAFVALVEPAVLLFMGGVVLLLVLSILSPIVSLNSLAGL